MEYRDLKKALEVLTEGGKARIPERLRGTADRLFQRHRSWLTDTHIQGFGIAARSVAGRWRPELALKVYVDQKLPAADIENPAPSEVRLPGIVKEPVPVDVEMIGTMRLDFDPIRYRTRPAIPGSSAAHQGVHAGTLGCLVQGKGDAGPLCVLGTCHTLAVSGLAAAGDPILQPSVTDGGHSPGDTIAQLVAWVQPIFSATGYPNRVDAAVARVTQPGLVTSHIHLIGHPVGVGKVRRGSIIQKTGRTSNYTVGMVFDLDYKFQIDWPQAGEGNGRVGFRDQVLCTKYAAGGDSGAAVLTMQGRVVGLHVGGTEWTSVFCRIEPALKALECRLVPDPV
jgi:hypothetical protein